MFKMLAIELNEKEVKLIVDSLRSTEKASRIGFGKRVAREMGEASSENDEAKTREILARMVRAKEVFQAFVNLRARFGDKDFKVKID